MAKSLHHYLPQKEKELTMINGRVPTKIVDEVRKHLEQDGLSWAELLTACLKQYLDEKKK